ncbi:LysR substrate-binding domain-containing protein [Acinetobacter gerneri]|uniref:LysR substrate-binding domain-containing protein n=1 Tax=Acinetobacter gerneri TaxID=202952 RepID=A0AAW8JST9_9GAMM|nr:LysR substrate-binding domain-containing protein [Acinetobacter gerneri]MDQ9011297.1 LysR substrate-binding domain-containing protein [Acinetobacter gerneri]MDQ9015422.1 LysR substrate-binding domain-containing protein [Acinetobacter gerneri]MDQ9026604.1 LysR substrate-binding domain-containing protein [Acinetobacter gerneri]MDQ9053874.1 LysR substrate-binding domain-containing protein [Acinetobacter gerneri]MDQ9061555.1 LysR substrate-binding domain-containing protein [Acinetobacter gerner
MKMRNLPPLNALKMFEAVARNSSFSLAAEELCITHSAVSHQIKLLESWMGVKLLQRHSHGATLTPAGQILFTTCVQLFNSLENCVNDIQQKPINHGITLGAPSSFMANWLISRIENFEEKYPEIQIKLMTSNDFKLLENEQIDLQILSLNRQVQLKSDLVKIHLFKDKIGPVLSQEKAHNITQPSDLLTQTLLHTESNKNAWSFWATQHQVKLNEAKNQRYFDHLNLMLEASANGLGIAIAPEILVEKQILNGQLVAPFGFTDSDAEFTLCLKQNRLKNSNLQTFIEWIQYQVSID